MQHTDTLSAVPNRNPYLISSLFGEIEVKLAMEQSPERLQKKEMPAYNFLIDKRLSNRDQKNYEFLSCIQTNLGCVTRLFQLEFSGIC